MTLDQIKGGLFGLAIGDALGGTTEFMTPEEIRSSYGVVNEIIGGGVWDLQKGEVTDDTAMTIAVAKGIIQSYDDPIEEIGQEFIKWYQTNTKDIGNIIRTVFEIYNGNWFQAAESAHKQLNNMSAGNGSLMRCLPIAFVYRNINKMEQLTRLQSSMTHYDELASEACVIYNRIARRLLNGEPLTSSIKEEISNTMYDISYDKMPTCPPDGYVVHSMKWVLYWLLNSQSFEEVVIGATNMGNDSDTIAAIAGGLKGLEVGFEGLPKRYVRELLNYEVLNQIAEELFAL